MHADTPAYTSRLSIDVRQKCGFAMHPAIHTQPAIPAFHRFDRLSGSKLTLLIGFDDFRVLIKKG